MSDHQVSPQEIRRRSRPVQDLSPKRAVDSFEKGLRLLDDGTTSVTRAPNAVLFKNNAIAGVDHGDLNRRYLIAQNMCVLFRQYTYFPSPQLIRNGLATIREIGSHTKMLSAPLGRCPELKGSGRT